MSWGEISPEATAPAPAPRCGRRSPASTRRERRLSLAMRDFIGKPVGVVGVDFDGERTVFTKGQYALLRTHWALERVQGVHGEALLRRSSPSISRAAFLRPSAACMWALRSLSRRRMETSVSSLSSAETSSPSVQV